MKNEICLLLFQLEFSFSLFTYIFSFFYLSEQQLDLFYFIYFWKLLDLDLSSFLISLFFFPSIFWQSEYIYIFRKIIFVNEMNSVIPFIYTRYHSRIIFTVS